MYEGQRLGSPLHKNAMSKQIVNGEPRIDESDDSLEKQDSEVEVEIVGDTKKIYVYSPVFTKEDEELYRFVSSRVEEVPPDNKMSHSSSSSDISSTDSLEASSKPTSKSDTNLSQAKSKHSQQNDDLRDSLDNTWADPPRMEDVVSAIPPLELRDVETPSKPRSKKKQKKKSELPKKELSKQSSNHSHHSHHSQVQEPPTSMPSQGPMPAFVPTSMPGAPPGTGIMYFAQGGGAMPIPFPFFFPNQVAFGGGAINATVQKSSASNDSEDTLTEKTVKHKKKHHKKSDKDKKHHHHRHEEGSDTSSREQKHSSSTLNDSLNARSGTSSRDDNYGEYSGESQRHGQYASGVPWTTRDELEEYYERVEPQQNSQSQQLVSSKPFGRENVDDKVGRQKRGLQKVQPPPKKEPAPLPFRRKDVDYVEANKRTYGRLKGSSYGQILGKRQEDSKVTNMIDEERQRIRMKVEMRAAEMRQLNKKQTSPGGKQQQFDETEGYGYYDDYYDEEILYQEGEGDWSANAEQLAYIQQKKAILRKANDGNSSAPVRGGIPPPGHLRKNVKNVNQLQAVSEETAVPTRYRVNHEIEQVMDHDAMMGRGRPQPQHFQQWQGQPPMQQQQGSMANFQLQPPRQSSYDQFTLSSNSTPYGHPPYANGYPQRGGGYPMQHQGYQESAYNANPTRQYGYDDPEFYVYLPFSHILKSSKNLIFRELGLINNNIPTNSSIMTKIGIHSGHQ